MSLRTQAEMARKNTNIHSAQEPTEYPDMKVGGFIEYKDLKEQAIYSLTTCVGLDIDYILLSQCFVHCGLHLNLFSLWLHKAII